MKHVHCPVNGWDCPYFYNNATGANAELPAEECLCTIGDPMEECDDFACVWDEDDDYWDECDDDDEVRG